MPSLYNRESVLHFWTVCKRLDSRIAPNCILYGMHNIICCLLGLFIKNTASVQLQITGWKARHRIVAKIELRYYAMELTVHTSLSHSQWYHIISDNVKKDFRRWWSSTNNNVSKLCKLTYNHNRLTSSAAIISRICKYINTRIATVTSLCIELGLVQHGLAPITWSHADMCVVFLVFRRLFSKPPCWQNLNCRQTIYLHT